MTIHLSLNARPRPHPQTASRVFDGEAVIITPAQNIVRLLNTTGSRIWELCDGQHTLQAIIDTLVDEFDVTPEQAQTSVQRFIQHLLDLGLLSLEIEDSP